MARTVRGPRAGRAGRRTESRGWRDDRGSGTALVVGLVAVVLVLAAALGVLVRAQSARSTAQTAADLAALAAADSIDVPPGVVLAPGLTGRAEVCDLAGRVVERNTAVMSRCEVLPDGVVQVTAWRSAGVGVATATARAGPNAARNPGP